MRGGQARCLAGVQEAKKLLPGADRKSPSVTMHKASGVCRRNQQLLCWLQRLCLLMILPVFHSPIQEDEKIALMKVRQGPGREAHGRPESGPAHLTPAQRQPCSPQSGTLLPTIGSEATAVCAHVRYALCGPGMEQSQGHPVACGLGQGESRRDRRQVTTKHTARNPERNGRPVLISRLGKLQEGRRRQKPGDGCGPSNEGEMGPFNVGERWRESTEGKKEYSHLKQGIGKRRAAAGVEGRSSTHITGLRPPRWVDILLPTFRLLPLKCCPLSSPQPAF